jgi:hypothetical protein
MDFIMEGLPDSIKDKVGKCLSSKELWDKLHTIFSSLIMESEVSLSSYKTDLEEQECVINISELFFFNCEEHKHLEIEFLYLKIESENPNEIEDNRKIEKENNHEVEPISALDELRK